MKRLSVRDSRITVHLSLYIQAQAHANTPRTQTIHPSHIYCVFGRQPFFYACFGECDNQGKYYKIVFFINSSNILNVLTLKMLKEKLTAITMVTIDFAKSLGFFNVFLGKKQLFICVYLKTLIV